MLKLKIVSPEKIEFDGEAVGVTVPGQKGSFEILQNHAPIISALVDGPLTYKTADGQETQLMVSGGFVSVQKNEVSVCVEKDQQI